MSVKVTWKNVPSSDFIDPVLERETRKLSRQFPGATPMDVRLAQNGQRYQAQVHVMALGRDWWVSGDGENLSQSIANAFERIMRNIGEFKRLTRDHINKRFQRPRPSS